MLPTHTNNRRISLSVGSTAERINRLLRHFKLQVSRYPRASDRRRLRLMEGCGVDYVIDVGANTGQYGALLRGLGYSGWIVSYEPLPSAFLILQRRAKHDRKWRVIQSAVGDRTGTLVLNVAENSASSSALVVSQRTIDVAPETRFVSRVEVECTTLAGILNELPAQAPMLKIDTQGYEDRVLTGAGTGLERLVLLELELSLFEVYMGQVLFRTIDERLLSGGFALVSLAEGFYNAHSGELLQIDAVYARADKRQNVRERG